jgi:hypothetical protein
LTSREAIKILGYTRARIVVCMSTSILVSYEDIIIPKLFIDNGLNFSGLWTLSFVCHEEF